MLILLARLNNLAGSVLTNEGTLGAVIRELKLDVAAATTNEAFEEFLHFAMKNLECDLPLTEEIWILWTGALTWDPGVPLLVAPDISRGPGSFLGGLDF